MDDQRYRGLNLTPPAGGFELYRHRNADRVASAGWPGLYWARKNAAGDYEIRAVSREGEAYSYPGGVFPAESFERHYEKVEL